MFCCVISSRLKEIKSFMWLRLRNAEEKKKKDICLFLLENSRPLSSPQEPQIPCFSSSGIPDFLSTCLRTDSLTNSKNKKTFMLSLCQVAFLRDECRRIHCGRKKSGGCVMSSTMEWLKLRWFPISSVWLETAQITLK